MATPQAAQLRVELLLGGRARPNADVQLAGQRIDERARAGPLRVLERRVALAQLHTQGDRALVDLELVLQEVCARLGQDATLHLFQRLNRRVELGERLACIARLFTQLGEQVPGTVFEPRHASLTNA